MKSFLQKLILFIAVLILTACDLTITPNPNFQLNLKPTSTPILTATQSPTVNPVFTVIPPTANPVYFRDEFNGKLEAGWTWVREIPGTWSLISNPGALRIDTGEGYVNAETMSNMLLRPVPSGDYQIETRLTYTPRANFQFAGLIIFESPSNFLQAGYGYCQSISCVGEGIYMNYYENGITNLPNFAQAYRSSNPIVLRLIHKGNTYIFQISAGDGMFFTVGKQVSDMKPLQIGLITGQNVGGEIVPAQFDYFEITTPQ